MNNKIEPSFPLPPKVRPTEFGHVVQWIMLFFSYGLVYYADGSGAFYMINVPRNVVGPRAQSFTRLYGRYWTGHVCLKNFTASHSKEKVSSLAVGYYRIRYSALKHFGNINNPNDYDVYHTPPFALVY